MQVLVVAGSALAGLALMLFATSRTLPRATLPWQITACLVYLAIGIWAMIGPERMPMWTAALLAGGGVGVLATVVIAGLKPGLSSH